MTQTSSRKVALITGVTGQDGAWVLDVSRLAALGWRASTALRDGIQKAYDTAPFASGSATPPLGNPAAASS